MLSPELFGEYTFTTVEGARKIKTDEFWDNFSGELNDHNHTINW